MPRHDQQDPARDKFGKRVVSYPSGSKAYPTVTESRPARKAGIDKTSDFRSTHPDFATAYLTERKLTGGDDVDRIQVDTFETLPGPWLPFTRNDLRLGKVIGRRRAVLSDPAQQPSQTATTTTTYAARGESTVVSIQIEENFGSAVSGFSAFPIVTGNPYDDKVRGSISWAEITVVKTGMEVSDRTESGGVVTNITYEPSPGNENLLIKRTETWTLPGPLMDAGDTPDDRAKIFITKTKQLKKLSGGGITSAFSTLTSPTRAQQIHKEDYDLVSAFEVITIWPDSPYNSSGSALEEDASQAYEFPGYIYCYGEYLGVTFTGPDFFGADVGTKQASSENALFTTKTFWVIGAKPTAPVDIIAPGNVVIQGLVDDVTKNYRHVLFDDLIRPFLGGWGLQTVLGTMPTFTEYFGSAGSVSAGSPPATPFPVSSGGWIGTSRCIRGKVEEDGHPNRFRVTLTFTIMR